MNRRSALVALALLCVFVPACLKVDKRINKANLAKIKAGMTRDEIEAILGPGEDIGGESGFGSSGAVAGIGTMDSVSSRPPPTVRWGNEYTNITIIFDRAGKLQDLNNVASKGLK